MKTLTIIAIILGIAFLFFVAKAEKSFIINSNEAIPAGLTGIPKALLDKAGEIGNMVTGPISTNNIVAGAKDFISETIDKITETIKAPIEDRINDILCPQK